MVATPIMMKAHGQRGIALILAIGFLAVLSILGAVVLNVATRDMKESAQTLPKQRSLYAADRAVEYSMNRDIIINMAVSGEVDLIADDVKTAAGVEISGVKHKEIIDASGVGEIDKGTVKDLGPRALPAAMAAIHGTEFGANLYHVSVETSSGAEKTFLDASIVRLFKMDDDQIFRTSGGG